MSFLGVTKSFRILKQILMAVTSLTLAPLPSPLPKGLQASYKLSPKHSVPELCAVNYGFHLSHSLSHTYAWSWTPVSSTMTCRLTS